MSAAGTGGKPERHAWLEVGTDGPGDASPAGLLGVWLRARPPRTPSEQAETQVGLICLLSENHSRPDFLRPAARERLGAFTGKARLNACSVPDAAVVGRREDQRGREPPGPAPLGGLAAQRPFTLLGDGHGVQCSPTRISRSRPFLYLSPSATHQLMCPTGSTFSACLCEPRILIRPPGQCSRSSGGATRAPRTRNLRSRLGPACCPDEVRGSLGIPLARGRLKPSPPHATHGVNHEHFSL